MTYFTQTTKALAVMAALALPAMAFAAEPAMVDKKNGVLTDHAGMALYTFDKDSGGKSMCNDQCANNWPPLVAEKGAKPMGEWTLITRDDGKQQWAYEGKPIYTFAMDKKGEKPTGDGKGGVWHVVKPD